jgi:opacity protein-like surface antigen
MKLFILIFALLSSAQAGAYVELGAAYNYKKSSFDMDNNTESQSTTGSVSLYFFERIALELSYTNGLYVKKERNTTLITNPIVKTTQYTNIYGTDLVFVFADRKTKFQPYVKAGAAYVDRKQVGDQDGANPYEIIYKGTSPSAGVGFKLFLTEAFAIKASYDYMKTPVSDGIQVEEVSGRFGISWML